MRPTSVWTPRRFTERADVLQFMLDMKYFDFIYHWDDLAADCLSRHGLTEEMTAGIQANVDKMLEVCDRLKIEPFGMAMTIDKRGEHDGPMMFETDVVRMTEAYAAILDLSHRLLASGFSDEKFDRDYALEELERLNMYPQNMHETLAFEIAFEAM